jgi:SAM-dependent methyltransferase
MGATGWSAEKRFYEENVILHQSPDAALPSAQQRWVDMHAPGDRYYCITDFLKNEEGQFEAVEWGFGDPARCTALNRFFSKYIAIDICATTLVEKAGHNFGRSFSYQDVDLNDDLPFEDESFDVSIAMMVIEHLFDPFHSFREIARTTKRGGYVFVNLPLLSSFKTRLAVLCGKLPVTSTNNWWDLKQWDGGHLHYFTISAIRRLAAENNLKFVRFYVVGKFLKLKRIAPSLFCHEGSFVFQRV